MRQKEAAPILSGKMGTRETDERAGVVSSIGPLNTLRHGATTYTSRSRMCRSLSILPRIQLGVKKLPLEVNAVQLTATQGSAAVGSMP